MNSFFGIGSAELLLVLFLAGIVLGPERIALVARKLGYWVVRMRHIGQMFMREIRRELNDADPDGVLQATMSSTMSELESLRTEVRELKKDMMQIGQEPEKVMAEADRILNQEEEHSIAPNKDQPLPKLLVVEDDMDE